MRRDRLSYFEYKRETTPFMDKLAREGWVFDQAISQTYWSPPSHYTMLTGLYPYQHGATQMTAQAGGSIKPLPKVKLLPEILHDLGYNTWTFTGCSWTSPRSGLTRGFDHFFGFQSFLASPGAGWGGRKLKKLKENFKSAQKPFFLLMSLRDTHCDYDVPEKFRQWAKTRSLDTRPDVYYAGHNPKWTKTDCQEMNDRYDESVLYEDYITHQLVDWLGDNGFMDNTVIIFCGDHGEALCDRRFQDRYLFEHTCVLYDEIIRVPLVVWGPGFSHREIVGPVELRKVYDLALSIAKGQCIQPKEMESTYTLSWISYPKIIADIWRRRRPGYDNPYIFSPKLAVRSSKWKYIKVDRVGEELYNLQDDPGETTNIFEPQHPEVLKMQEFLREVKC